MNEPIDKRLQTLFADTPETVGRDDFENRVMRRISGIRRARLVWRSVVAIALVLAAILVSPLATTSGDYVAEWTATLMAPLDGFVGTPVAFALGTLCVFGALLDLRRR